MTRQLLTFAGKHVIAPTVLNLNDQIEGMSPTLRRLCGEDIEIVTNLSSGLWKVLADPAQLDLVLMDLVVNAQAAMPNGGVLTMATTNVPADDEHAPRGAEVMPGPYVMVAVADTGTGMTDHVAHQIFEPFFTTKEWGADTAGLGLSTCYGVVRQLGGHIRVQTAPGKGSTFRIYLPRQSVTAVAGDSADRPFGRRLDNVTVLVVDDEATVRTLAAGILRTRGYAVLEAASGAEACMVARAWHGQIHLLVTDVRLPGMNGWELARLLHEERPGLETLYISGHPEHAVADEAVGDRRRHFLQKPFAPGALVQKVRTLLDGAAD